MVDLASLMARICFNKTKLTQLTVIADVKTVQDGSWSGAWPLRNTGFFEALFLRIAF